MSEDRPTIEELDIAAEAILEVLNGYEEGTLTIVEKNYILIKVEIAAKAVMN